MSLEQFWTISEFLFKYTKNQPIVYGLFAESVLALAWQVTTKPAHEDKTLGPGANFEPVANENEREYPINEHVWATMIRLSNRFSWGV